MAIEELQAIMIYCKMWKTFFQCSCSRSMECAPVRVITNVNYSYFKSNLLLLIRKY